MPTTETPPLPEESQEKPKEEVLEELNRPPVTETGNGDRKQVLLGDPKRPLGDSTILPNCYDKLEVKQSPLEGFGVFATEKIPRGTVLEEVPVIVWPRVDKLSEQFYKYMVDENFISTDELHNDKIRGMFGLKHPSKYYFKWFPPNSDKTSADATVFQCLPLGYGPIYNSANALNNASWTVKEKTFIFSALRDIEPGEEIFTFYGYFVVEDGSTFNIDEVFGFGLEITPLNSGGSTVLLRNIRWQNEKDQARRAKEEGVRKLLKAFNASQGCLKLDKICVVDEGEDKHPFDFPEDWPLKFTYLKLKEFKETRFTTIKLWYKYLDLKTKKEMNGDITFTNHNATGG